jgi:hypothetical protein
VNRRNFLNSLLVAGASFSILPGAGRLWVAKKPDLIWRHPVWRHPEAGCSLTQASFAVISPAMFVELALRESSLHFQKIMGGKL